ncbi:MAG: glycosyltransferase family 39 protein [Anaerolineae bacterium]|nr:glycosyltransferase family 39 protein [Anaerolineae bacterium]
MNLRVLYALAFLLLGLMIGWIVSRLVFPEADGLAALLVAFLGGLGLGVLVMGARARRGSFGQNPKTDSDAAPVSTPEPLEPVQPETAAPALAATTIAAQTMWSSSRLALTRKAHRFSASARDFGKYDAVRFSVVLPPEWFKQGDAQTAPQLETRAILRSWANVGTFALVMFLLSLGVYAFTRLYRIGDFPISFLGDEAVVVRLARDLVRNGFNDPKLGWFPLYFDFFFVVNPLISVYLQALTIPVFGVSIEVARGTAAIFTVFGVMAVALTLKMFFGARYWWAAVLVLALTPTWFFHSRTVFDTVTATAFYAIFIFCYLLYRYRSPRYLFLAVLSAAAVFYSYPAAQLILALTAVLLALSDVRYHLAHYRVWLFALPLIVLLLAPYLRFTLDHPDESWYHLRSVDSYVVKDLPLGEKMSRFVARYVQGISPLFWFFPNSIDLTRHRMLDYGHLPLFVLPLMLTGVGICFAKFRESKYRVLLIALVSAPFAAALADILILRLLIFVIPAILLAMVGMEWLLNRFAARLNPQLVGAGLFVVLTAGSLWVMRDALINGPTWFRPYDLYGMQWGARQLFQVLHQVRAASPRSPIVLTSSWSNGTEEFVNLLMPDDGLIQTRTIDAWIENKLALSRNMIFVLTPSELREARESGKFKRPVKIQRIKYPDGTDGFQLVRLEYVDNVDEIFRIEKEERARPVTDDALLNGETVKVVHSQFDGGRVQDMFDGDKYTLARGREANPLLIEIIYPTPRPISSMYASFGRMRSNITVTLYPPDSAAPRAYVEQDLRDEDIPEITMQFPDPPALVQSVRVEIEHLDSPGQAKVHVRELQLR